MPRYQNKIKKCRICNYTSKKNKQIKLPFMNDYFICAICNTYNQDLNKIKSIKKFFQIQQKNYFSDLKMYNSNLMHKIESEYDTNKIKYFLKYCKNKKFNILEIGPGSGKFASEIKKSNKDITVIDESKIYIQSLKKLNIKAIHKNFLSYSTKKKYRFICCFHVIEHVADVKLFVKKIANLLCKKGIVLLSTPNAGSSQHKFLRSFSPNFDYAHLHLFTKKTLEKIFKDNGLAIIETVTPQENVFWLSVCSKIIRRIKKISEIETAGQYVYNDSKIINFIFYSFKLLTFPLRKVMEILGNGSEIFIVAKKIK
jgi:2-polyprenyl-3-methyl-5-hydroxy-6-metoxy-1,4-benzoquinol methylase